MKTPNSRGLKLSQETIAKEMLKVAKRLKKPASSLSRKAFFENTTQDISLWDLRKVGGFKSVRDLFFNDKCHCCGIVLAKSLLTK